MTPQQKYAVEWHMAEPPDAATWEDALEQIRELDNLILPDDYDPEYFDERVPVVWEPFEDFPSWRVAQFIEDMAEQLTERFDPKDEPIRL